MKHKLLLLLVVSVFSVIFCATNVFAVPVDLNDFTKYPDSAVDIASDGSSATFYEDWSIAPISLENWIFDIPLDAFTLTFHYELVVPTENVVENIGYNVDYFNFYINDATTPAFSDGGGQGTYSGGFSYNLTTLAGDTVPVIFDLMYGWDDYNPSLQDWGYESVLTISNVEINPVPEPATLLLLGIGLIGLARIRKKVAA